MKYKNLQEYYNVLQNNLDKAEELIELNKIDKANEIMQEIETENKENNYSIVNLANEIASNNAIDLANKRALEGGSKTINAKVLDRDNNKIFLGGKEMEVQENREYKENFFNYLQGKLRNDMATVSSSGAVIPVETFGKVIDNIKKQIGIISKVRILNIPGKMVIPQSQIIEGAVWHTEGTEIGDTTKDTNNVSLSGYELAKLFSMSVATQSMSMAEFELYLTTELTNAITNALNSSILEGTGEGQASGIISKTKWDASNSKTYKLDTAFSDIISGMSLLASNFRQNACWYMNSTTLYSLMSKTDTTGQPIFTQGTATEPLMKLLGKEIVIDDYIADDVILFGDASYYFLNFSKPITIQRSEDAGFTKASIIYRAISVVDGKLVAPSFIKFTKEV